MKKYLERLLITVLCTLILLPNFCYADVIVSPVRLFMPLLEIIIPCVLVMIIISSLLILKRIVKQAKSNNTNLNEYIEEKRKNEILRNQNKIYKCLVFLCFIISLIGCQVGSEIYLIMIIISIFLIIQTISNNTDSVECKNNIIEENNDKILKNESKIYTCFLFLIFLIILLAYQVSSKIYSIIINIFLIILSIIFRKKEKRKMSYIICCIAFLVIVSIPFGNYISEKKVENYNNQFLQYIESEEYHDNLNLSSFARMYDYVLDINGLITTAINSNNQNKWQISLIYNDNTYTTESELEQLLSILDTSSKYYISLEKDYSNHYCILSITLSLDRN